PRPCAAGCDGSVRRASERAPECDILSVTALAENKKVFKLRKLVAPILILLLNACASLPPQTGRTATYALNDTQATRLGTAFGPREREHPGENAFHLLPNGLDALVARIVLTEAADRTLDLQYYIWHDDLTGRELA